MTKKKLREFHSQTTKMIKTMKLVNETVMIWLKDQLMSNGGVHKTEYQMKGGGDEHKKIRKQNINNGIAFCGNFLFVMCGGLSSEAD